MMLLKIMLFSIAIAFFIGIGVLAYQQTKHCGWYAKCDPHYYENGIYHEDYRPL